MPTLNWIGKDAVINHHKEVPFRLLKCRADLSVGDPDSPASGNLLVQGDNLEALKALLPYYAGQVKCIYIDPPYNTGNEGWVYNDNVNSPEIKDWLNKTVGGESEDLSRHDKWLCMMYPRLTLLHQMLRDDGSLWMSLDDVEVHHARSLLDEIFGAKNFIATVIWQKKQSTQNDAINLSDMHDYILVYAKNAKTSRNDPNGWQRNLLPREAKHDKRYSNPDNDPRGNWTSGDCTCNKSDVERPNLYFAIINPNTRKEVWPSRQNVWRFEKKVFEKLVSENRIWWGAGGANFPRFKRFRTSVAEGVIPSTWWPRDEAGDNQEARREVRQLLSDISSDFSTPKPVSLIQRILQIATNPNDLVLDSFAGSGTTGHAVLQIGGNRRYILVEMDENICKNITAERLKRASIGHEWKDQKGHKKQEEGLGGGFRFCELGVTLFDPNRQIREEVKYNDLAQHVYFIETGQPLPNPPPFPKGKGAVGPLLGVHNGTAVYLLYNGILKDKSVNGGNVLTYEVLEGLPPSVPPFSHSANGKTKNQQGENGGMSAGQGGLKVIYGNGCRISAARLRELGIVFKQIPYEIREM